MQHATCIAFKCFFSLQKCWFEFCGNNGLYRYQNKELVKCRKHFSNIEYDAESRKFSGTIFWHEGPMEHEPNAFKYQIEIVFSPTFDRTMRFKEIHYDRNEVPLRTYDESTEKFILYDWNYHLYKCEVSKNVCHVYFRGLGKISGLEFAFSSRNRRFRVSCVQILFQAGCFWV